MKPGRIVQIRVSPRDCISAVDLMKELGISLDRLSFAQVISHGFAGMMETFRQQNILPEPNEFEYLNVMSRFPGDAHSNRAEVLKRTRSLQIDGSERRAPTVKIEKNPKIAAAKYRYNKLRQIRDLREFTEEESAEWTDVIGIIAEDQ